MALIETACSEPVEKLVVGVWHNVHDLLLSSVYTKKSSINEVRELMSKYIAFQGQTVSDIVKVTALVNAGVKPVEMIVHPGGDDFQCYYEQNVITDPHRDYYQCAQNAHLPN